MIWMFVVASKPLKFMHITKTAGTTIEALGRKYNLSWGYYHTTTEPEYGFWHDLPQTKPPDVLRKYDWFTVVRNPFERVVSEFWCKWGGRGRPRIVTRESFNTFLRDRIRKHAHDLRGGHYIVQSHYLSLLNVSPDMTLHILHYETLATDVTKLFNLYGLHRTPILLPVLNKAKLPHSQSVHDLDSNTMDLIKRVYASDFAIFGYNTSVVSSV